MDHSNADSDQFAQCVIDCQRTLYAYILKLTHNSADAKDVLQETNVVLLSKRDEFPTINNFSAWAARIALYQVMAHRTRQGRDRVAFSDDLVRTIAEQCEDKVDPADPNLRNLSHCLNELPDHDRHLIDLRYTDDLRPREIAEQVGRTPSAVSQALYRIRLALAECLERERAKEGGA